MGKMAPFHHRQFSNASLASQSTVFDESVPAAIVLWWDDRVVCVRCPYCRGRHSHRSQWNNRRPVNRLEICCFPVSDSRYAKTELSYHILYPFQSSTRNGASLGWEIDKVLGRFVTVGVEKNEEDWDTDYSNDEGSDHEYYESQPEEDATTTPNEKREHLNGATSMAAKNVDSSARMSSPQNIPVTRRTQSISSITATLKALDLRGDSRLSSELCLLMEQMHGLGIVEADERVSLKEISPPSTAPELYRSTTMPTTNAIIPTTPQRPRLVRDMVQTEPRIKTTKIIDTDVDPFTSPKASRQDIRPPIMLDAESSTWIQNIDSALEELARKRRWQLKSRYFFFIRRNDLSELRSLLDSKSFRRVDSFSSRDRRGNTGLILAARYGYMRVAELLFNKHSTVQEPINKQNKRGRTALMEAALWGNLHIVEYLLSLNADPNLEDKSGRTALSLAANTLRNTRERRQRSKTISDTPSHIRTQILFRLRARMKDPIAAKAHPFAQFPSVSRRNFSTSESFFSTSKFGLSTTHSSRKQTAETTHFKLPDQYKTIGRLDRGPLFPVWYALSGYSHSEYSTQHVLDNSEWTEKALDLRDALRWWPQNKSYPSHVEPQLVAFYISKHVLLNDEHEGLHKVMPPILPQAEILVSQAEPCRSCGGFLEKVKRHLKINVEVKRNDPKDENCKIIIKSDKDIDDLDGTTFVLVDSFSIE